MKKHLDLTHKTSGLSYSAPLGLQSKRLTVHALLFRFRRRIVQALHVGQELPIAMLS